MRQFIFLLVGLVLAGAIAVTVVDFDNAPPPEHGGETADRLSDARMAHMVAGPMKLVAKKDMAGAAKLFEADLAAARAKGGLHPGDLLFAYGVQLRVAEHEKASIPYFRRAVDAYRAAAPGSPELALALADYGRVLLADSPDAPSPEALPALREALKIREAALGRRNAETAVAYVRLGELEGLPVYTARDPARVAAAAERIRTGIRLLPDAPNADPQDIQVARLSLAELYARNGDVSAAFKASGDYLSANPSFGPYQLRQVATIFEKGGDPATGLRLRQTYGIPDEKDDDDGDGGTLTEGTAPSLP
jgi:tetratricopeptide (TPR) repeat protein